MGQFALGIRSLLLKSAVFVIMAALLAWALGGTLFPRPEAAIFDSQAVRFNGGKWYWRVLVGGKTDGEVRWELLTEDAEGKSRVFAETDFIDVAALVVGDDGLYYAGRPAGAKAWTIARVDEAGASHTQSLPDRLAVEQQLVRVSQGLPLQDAATIARQRVRVLDPDDDSADE